MWPSTKSAIKAALPEPLHPHNLARARILKRSGGVVIAGPFAGQIYITSEDDFIEPGMLMGVYEQEIYPAIERIIRSAPKLFIDVGASQGYYSVGFARRAPKARHIAFEIYPPRIAQLERTMRANKVEVQIEGNCTPEALQAAISQTGDAFVLVDVDGYENDLMNPASVPALSTAQIIVETHDHIVPGITSELIRRFKPTHDIEVIESTERTAKDLPFLLCDRWTVGQLNEGRGVIQHWLVMRPRSTA